MKTILVGVSPDDYDDEKVAVEIEHDYYDSDSLVHAIESAVKVWAKNNPSSASLLWIQWCELDKEWSSISNLLLSKDCLQIDGIHSVKLVDAVPILAFRWPEE